MHPRPIRATFHTGALVNNLARVRNYAPTSKVLAVIKANAYGHGLLRVAAALRGADGFALLDLSEAIRLREAGFAHRIVLLEGFFSAKELHEVARYRLTLVVHHEAQLEGLERTRMAVPVDVMLKFNSGMNRLGFPESRWQDAVKRAQRCAGISGVMLMTHFACADDARGIAPALARFEQACAGMVLARSLANSATIMRYPQAHAEWVRPGIMLYGSSPFETESASSLGLQAVMELDSEIIATQELAPGDCVGYGASFSAERPMRIGVVACGYADGYPRHAPSGTPVLVNGQRTFTVGRVSMDMLMVDITYLLSADVGAKVQLWGQDLSVDEVAHSAGTVGYELLCALAPRVPQREVD